MNFDVVSYRSGNLVLEEKYSAFPRKFSLNVIEFDHNPGNTINNDEWFLIAKTKTEWIYVKSEDWQAVCFHQRSSQNQS